MKKILLLITSVLYLTSCANLGNNYSKDNPRLDAYIRKELVLPRYDFSKSEYFHVYKREQWIEPEYAGTDRGGYLSFNYHFDDESLFEARSISTGPSTYYPLFEKMQAIPVETHMSVDVTSSSLKYKNTFDSTIIIPKYYTAIARSWDSFCEQNDIFNVFKYKKDVQSSTSVTKKSDVNGFHFYRHYIYGTYQTTETCDLKLDAKTITYSYKKYPRNSYDTVTDSQEFIYSFGTNAYLDGFEGGRININSNFDASTYYFSHYDLNAGYQAYCAYNVFKAFNEMAKAKNDYKNITYLTSYAGNPTGDPTDNPTDIPTNNYTLTVTSEDTSKGTVSGSGTYAYNASVTVTATPKTGYSFTGWYDDSTRVSSDASYTFNLPANGDFLIARFKSDLLTYGLYPQTRVSDPSLILDLESLSSSSVNSQGYYSYNGELYYPYTAKPYSDDYKFEDGSWIDSGINYWFKVEPIEWKVLDDDNEYFVTSAMFLDVHEYNEYYNRPTSKTDYQGNTGEAYANNYKYSEIRSWLNTYFYDMAFFSENSRIKVTTVDNSASTTASNTNEYACENTNDKVFLLSYKDLNNSSYGFNSYDSRKCKPTDFALARGAYYSSSDGAGYYWTRSPLDYYSDLAFCVHNHGHLFDSRVYYSYSGVRPALKISL